MRGRIILQDVATQFYLAADSSWVKGCQQARVFEHTYLALLEGLDHHEKTTQVVWCFKNRDMNMYLAVRPGDSNCVQPCVFCPLAGRKISGSPI